jgi:hypothetical protein
MSIAFAQELKKLRAELEALKKRVESIESRPKPGPKPKRQVSNAVGQ